MRIFDVDFGNHLVSIVTIVAIVILVAAIIAFFVFWYLLRRYGDKIMSRSNTIRIFVLDVKNDRVSYFNSSRLRKRKTSSITTFYNQFSARNREALISWIGDLLDDADDVKNYIEVPTFIKKSNKSLGSILQVQKIDYKNEVIYLESTLLSHTVKKSRNGDVASFVSKDSFVKAIRSKNAEGISFCLNFFNKETKTNGISHLAYIQIKNLLVKYITNDVIMTEFDESRIIISNFAIEDKEEITEYIQDMVSKINSYLLIESMSEEIAISIGAIENQYFARDTKSILKNAVLLADLSKDRNQRIMFFDESGSNLSEESSFKTEVETIIEKGKIRYLYQPLFDTNKNRIFAYLSKAEPIDSMFSSISELKNFAIRTDDDQKLFSTIAKNTVVNFIEERSYAGLKLFIPITLNEVQHVKQTLGHIEAIKDANIVLIFDEKEIVKEIDKEYVADNLIETILSFKSKGYDVALEIENSVLTLSPHLYSMFDYYIIPFISDVKDNQAEKIPVFKDLTEKLLKYKKQIIASAIPNWDTIDLVYKFGINIISSDLIAPYNENIMPLNTRVISKIKKLEE